MNAELYVINPALPRQWKPTHPTIKIDGYSRYEQHLSCDVDMDSVKQQGAACLMAVTTAECSSHSTLHHSATGTADSRDRENS
ncbi:MAG TPA: hypothetical protein DEF41_01960 [Desulfovibrio sp.]|uniref:Uncharacterized protein n=1 Tax=Nitratidesulfovibrio vulgaris (strain ATCC 29579 / DSM 644 / CCUG 34227 / NCIMB 8303 / VKM B-1760 / Hildenborough) TaxID=882 RepID=Q725N3_NITV2|nr:hypothetical protein DVU_3391 [Nitratidesulfovibrio vulgaris str. Hildenborough]HBW14917.1 hypothetical protein [Desulfovibrio sp.]